MYDKLSDNYYFFVSKIEDSREPISFEEAKKHSKCVNAMNEELDALNRNQTWELVKLSHGKKTVGCR
jgi:hypothetical protein